MTEPTPFPDLFEIAARDFERFKKEFASYGIETDPGMEIRKGAGMLCYYDFDDRHIYLSMPDVNGPLGKLQLLMFRQVLGAETNEELMRFLAIFIPFVVAHEMTHHFRHRYGLFGEDSWYEEQLANKMAAAVNKHRLPPEEKAFGVWFLERSLKKLGAQIGVGEDALDSYYDIASSLHTTDQLSEDDMLNLQMAQELAPPGSSSATMILRQSGSLPNALSKRLAKRRELILNFNAQYADDAARYIYYQIGWVYVAIKSQESSYVDEFARKHLGMAAPLLEVTLPTEYPSGAIYACFKAARQIEQSAPVLGRYFHKRYRAFLLDYLTQNYRTMIQAVGDADDLNFDFLSVWNDHASDPLDYIGGLTLPAARGIFPSRIAHSGVLREVSLPADLPTKADQLLWDFVGNPTDGPIQNTVRVLEQLDALEVFRPLPPEVMLEISKKLYKVHYEVGETVVWDGEANNDVFILLQGHLEAIVRGGSGGKFGIGPGEVFGEIAWLTKGTRMATVRATLPAVCLVIKENDLRLLCYQNPSILLTIAARTAQRYRDLQRA